MSVFNLPWSLHYITEPSNPPFRSTYMKLVHYLRRSFFCNWRLWFVNYLFCDVGVKTFNDHFMTICWASQFWIWLNLSVWMYVCTGSQSAEVCVLLFSTKVISFLFCFGGCDVYNYLFCDAALSLTWTLPKKLCLSMFMEVDANVWGVHTSLLIFSATWKFCFQESLLLMGNLFVHITWKVMWRGNLPNWSFTPIHSLVLDVESLDNWTWDSYGCANIDIHSDLLVT